MKGNMYIAHVDNDEPLINTTIIRKHHETTMST